MLIIQKPKNKENYIKVSDALNRQLQEAGYQPIYKDEDGWYYLKTKEIKKFVITREEEKYKEIFNSFNIKAVKTYNLKSN